MENVGIDGWIILKWVINKIGCKLWNGLCRNIPADSELDTQGREEFGPCTGPMKCAKFGRLQLTNVCGVLFVLCALLPACQYVSKAEQQRNRMAECSLCMSQLMT